MRLHIALRAGVAIVPPRASDAIGLLENDEVLNARFAQLDGCAQSTGTGANDNDSMPVSLGCIHRLLSSAHAVICFGQRHAARMEYGARRR
jgi:hypothetical protein